MIYWRNADTGNLGTVPPAGPIRITAIDNADDGGYRIHYVSAE